MRIKCLVFLILLVAQHADLRGDVLFYVPFDTDASPSYARGGITFQGDRRVDILLQLLPVRTEKGVVGSAALVTCGRFTYPAGANFNTEQGTIALWVRPNWPGTDTNFYHVLFSADGWGMIYKYTDQTYLTFGIRDKRSNYSYAATADIQAWQPGEWHHVVGTWSVSQHFRRIYIDGKKVCEAGLESVYEPPKSLTIGATGTRYPLDGLVDEVYVFDTPLSDAEIIAGCERGRQGQQCWNVPKTMLSQGPPTQLPQAGAGRPPVFVNWSTPGAFQRDNGTRGEVCLNGYWRYQPATLGQTPSLRWFYRKVPWSDNEFHVLDENKVRVDKIDGRPPSTFRLCWVQREFTVPEEWKGRNIVLRIENLRGVGYVYLDGALLRMPGGKSDYSQIAMEPVDHDITKLASPGKTHVLTILSEGLPDDVWLRSYPGDVLVGDIIIETSTRKKTIGLKIKVENHTVEEQEVRAVGIICEDAAGDKVVKRITSEKTSKCGPNSERWLEIVEGWTDAKLWTPESPNLYWLIVQLQDAKERQIDRTLPVRFGFREFWIDKGDFYLNGHPVRLRGHSNVPLHTLSGNGCDAFIRAFYSAMKAIHLNSFYTMWGYFYTLPDVGVGLDKVLDIADEMGIMVMPDLSNPGHFGEAWEEAFIREHYKARVNNLVRRYRHHPSVIMWMAGGGLAHTYDFCPAKLDGSFNPEREHEQIRKYGSIAEEGRAMIRRADPTRPVFYHSSGNFGPVWTSMAYLGFDVELQERCDWPLAWSRRRHKPLMVTEFGFPVVCGWHKVKKPSPTLKEVYESESLFVEYAAMYFGEEPYWWETAECVAAYGPPPKLNLLRIQSPAMWRTKSLFAREGLRAWRTYGISFQTHAEMAFCFESTKIPCDVNLDPRRPCGVTDMMELSVEDATKLTDLGKAVREACTPLLAYIGGPGRDFTSKDHSFYAGERVRKQVVLINDTSLPAEAQIQWALEDARGGVLIAGQMRAAIAPGEIALGKYPLEMTLPECEERMQLRLKINADFGEGRLCADEMSIEVFPVLKPKTKTKQNTLLLYDPQGETEKLLRLGGYLFERAAPRQKGMLGPGRLFIIGRSALQRPGALEELTEMGFDEAVRGGMKVLIFEQATTQLMGLRLRETSPRHVFICAEGHPALKELRAEDFHHWRGESNLIAGYPEPDLHPKDPYAYPEHFWRWGNRGCVATYTIEKPQRGVFRPLLQCGFDLFETPLVEFMIGHGRIIFCQLDVTNRYSYDPVARRVVDNLIAYLLDTPACTQGTLRIVEPPETRKEKIFKTMPPNRTPAFWGVSASDLFLREFVESKVCSKLPGGAAACDPPVLIVAPSGKEQVIFWGLPDPSTLKPWQAMKLRRVQNILASNADIGGDVGPGVKTDEKLLYPEALPDFDPYRYWRW